MRWIPLLLTLLVSACGGVIPGIRPHAMPETAIVSTFAQAYAAGKKHLMEGRVGLAIVMFERALAIDPLSVAALNGVGTGYDGLHRPEVAQLYYARALAIDPRAADTINNMAVSAALAGGDETASQLFARAADLDPKSAMIRENIQIAQQMAFTSVNLPMTPEGIAPIDENRPRIVRTGFREFTLTMAGMGPLAALLASSGSLANLGIQCVPYARAVSGIALRGNAATWWDAASGVFARGNWPEPGSIMNFRAIDRMPLGHLAVVTEVINSREVKIDHANWVSPDIDRDGVSRGIAVMDVSLNNDWSVVRVQLHHSANFGSVYPIYGFIYAHSEHLNHSVMLASGPLLQRIMTEGGVAPAGTIDWSAYVNAADGSAR